jgi:hypothetical protein
MVPSERLGIRRPCPHQDWSGGGHPDPSNLSDFQLQEAHCSCCMEDGLRYELIIGFNSILPGSWGSGEITYRYVACLPRAVMRPLFYQSHVRCAPVVHDRRGAEA